MPEPTVEHSIPGNYQIRALLHGRRFQRAWHRARLEMVARMLPPAGTGLTLDAAAGAGLITWYFKAPAIVSADMRVSACQAVRTHTTGARSVAADLSALPFRNAAFARLYFLEAIEHLTPAAGVAAMAELHRVAQPGARCLITTPNYRSYWPLMEWALDTLKLTPPMSGAQHLSRYHWRELRRVCEAAGWNVTRLGTFNGIAPALGSISERAGAWALRAELARSHPAGALLYAICTRGSA